MRYPGFQSSRILFTPSSWSLCLGWNFIQTDSKYLLLGYKRNHCCIRIKCNLNKCKCGNYPKPSTLRLISYIYTEHSCSCRPQKVQRTCTWENFTQIPWALLQDFWSKREFYLVRSGIFWNLSIWTLVPSWIIHFLPWGSFISYLCDWGLWSMACLFK